MANERLNGLSGWRYPSNKNLLDNWYFRNPVNQRGVSGKITTLGYFIDRWRLTSGSVEITDGGLILSGTMVQILETGPDGPVTATALTSAGPKSTQYSAETKTFTVTGTGETLIAAKLEEGPYQTLAHKEGGVWVLNDPPPDLALELLKCRRYQLYLGEERCYGYVTNSTSIIRAVIPTSIRMAKTPTALIESSKVASIFANGSTIANAGISSVSAYAMDNSVMLTINLQNSINISANTVLFVYLTNVCIDANL